MDRYTHLAVADVAGALDTLPALPGELETAALGATGTAGARENPQSLDKKNPSENTSTGGLFMRMVAPTSGFSCPPMSTSVQKHDHKRGPNEAKKTPKPQEKQGFRRT